MTTAFKTLERELGTGILRLRAFVNGELMEGVESDLDFQDNGYSEEPEVSAIAATPFNTYWPSMRFMHMNSQTEAGIEGQSHRCAGGDRSPRVKEMVRMTRDQSNARSVTSSFRFRRLPVLTVSVFSRSRIILSFSLYTLLRGQSNSRHGTKKVFDAATICKPICSIAGSVLRRAVVPIIQNMFSSLQATARGCDASSPHCCTICVR